MQNLINVFAQAQPEDRRLAERSWWTYHELTTQIAAKFGFSPEVGAAVFAALSPNNDYHGNLRDTHVLLRGAASGLPVDQVRVCTFHNNKHKAWAIAHGAKPLDMIVYPKTRSFYLNIMDPTDPVPVTVDGHVYNAWRGQRISLKGAATKMNEKVYEVIAEDVRRLARQAGILPNVAQGVIWHTWRRIHGIKFQPQFELWCPETLSAGLGFEPATKWSKLSQRPKCPSALQADLPLYTV